MGKNFVCQWKLCHANILTTCWFSSNEVNKIKAVEKTYNIKSEYKKVFVQFSSSKATVNKNLSEKKILYFVKFITIAQNCKHYQSMYSIYILNILLLAFLICGLERHHPLLANADDSVRLILAFHIVYIFNINLIKTNLNQRYNMKEYSSSSVVWEAGKRLMV